MKHVAPMTLNLQKQRGVGSETFSGMMCHYPGAQPYSSLSSRIELRLPLSKSEMLRSKYSLFGSDRYIRLGRVLEDLDALAADIAYKHTGPSPMIVTACMDRMRLFSELKVESELQLEGEVAHVGRSSIRVSMCVSKVSDKDPPLRLASSTFLMVARARDQDIAQPVPKLIDNRYKLENSQKKIENDMPMLWSNDEISAIHRLHSQQRAHPEKFLWHREARDDKTILMHSQNRNLHGRMFGGHLMASAYELGWLVAYKLARQEFIPTFIDHVEFIRPVEIGSIVSFEAQVVYTNERNAIVDVHARVINPRTGESHITNTFHFGFDLGDSTRQVVPETYDQMVLFVNGSRRWQSFQQSILVKT